MTCAPALFVGKDKFDVRWREGVWLGIELEGGESLMGAGAGVAKARDVRRKQDNGGRWRVEDFDKFKEVRLVPCPVAAGGFEFIKGDVAGRSGGVH